MTDNTIPQRENVLPCDVLVIGGGIAGLLAAIKARDFVENVILVDKSFVGKDSESALSAAMTVVAPPGTDVDAWVKDLVEVGEYVSHQDIFSESLRHSYEYVKKLEELGVEYPKDKKTGDFLYLKSRGTKMVKATRHLGKVYGEFSGGEAVVMAYRKKAIAKKINILSRIYIASLLTDDSGKRVVGALGFDSRTGESYTFPATATVVATGGSSFRGDYAHVWCATGDGLRLAYDAGAELENMEFNLFNTGSPFFWWEGTGVAIELGARFLNSKKQEFMKKYHPLGDMADIGFITRAMALETKIGNGPPFYLTLNEIPDPNNEGYGAGYWSPQNMVAWMPKLIDRMKEYYDYDLFKEPLEWMPAYHENGGGVRANIECATNMPGLFVAGQAMSMSPDLHTGWSFARFTWSGYRSGESAGRFAAQTENKGSVQMDKDRILDLKKRIFEPLSRTGSVTVDNTYNELRRVLFAYDVLLLKHEDRMIKTLGELKRLQEDYIPKVIAPDAHELVKLQELQSMLLIAEITLRASIMRTESRSCHFREDYPYTDNDNWLKWIEVKKVGNEMTMRTEDFPIGSRYKIVPPPGKSPIQMPKEVWDALEKKENPSPVQWSLVNPVAGKEES